MIRYPAIIHADAEEPYFHAFSINAIGGEVPAANRTKKATTRIAKSVIAKSNYYVMSLYRELAKRTAAEYGSALTAYHPVGQGQGRAQPPHPGDRTDSQRGHHRFQCLFFSGYNGTDGLATGDFWRPGHSAVRCAQQSLAAAIDQRASAVQRAFGSGFLEPVFRTGAASRSQTNWTTRPLSTKGRWISSPSSTRGCKDRRDLPLKAVGDSGLDILAVEEYPVEKIQMRGELLEDLSESYSLDPFSEAFVQGAATRVKRTLNMVDHDKATFFARQNALARFDPELANAFLAQTGGESVRAACSWPRR